MNTHPYLRAYMAGITFPTMFLLVIMTAFVLARHVFAVPVPVERVIVFPMAIVPNLFGLWNMLYLGLLRRRHFPIGLHGALLPFVLAPVGLTLGSLLGIVAARSNGIVWLDMVIVPFGFVVPAFCGAVAVYYLIWKHLVGALNAVLGIA